MSKWLVYCLSVPIDFGWEHLSTVEDTAASIATDHARTMISLNQASDDDPVERFASDWRTAQTLALEAGWKGDHRGNPGPCVFWLPGNNVYRYAFAIKQGNDGTTFVVSPYDLPWLE